MSQKMTTRQTKAMETRRKIVSSAQKLISAKGFENIGIDEIANDAGVAIGTFYTYFKKKEDVIEELNKTDFYHLAEIAIAMEEKSLLEKLEYYCFEFLKEIENTGIEICRQWIRNNVCGKTMRLPKGEMSKYQYDIDAMQSILNTAKGSGELISTAPIEELALFINAELYGLMLAWCMTDAQTISSEKTKDLCNIILKAAIEPYINTGD